MVVMESEIISKGEVESPPKNQSFPSLGRQTSIYSLTLDEFQHTLCESGKNFGSMNMDEFLSSIWTAEENQGQAQNSNPATTTSNSTNLQFLASEQLSLTRQGSLTLPPPLCQKTVEEVWSEIHKSQQEQPPNRTGSNNNVDQNPSSAQQQPTFGEMTLEDFLVRAGVVREQCNVGQLSQQQQYRSYQNNNNPGVGPSFASRPMTGLGGSGSMPTYQPLTQGSVGGVGDSLGYVGNGKRSGGGGGYAPSSSMVCYGRRVGSAGGGGGYGPVQGLGMGSPVSPVSSDGMCVSQVDGTNQYGMAMGGMRGGRKRIIDGPVEKVVERRQRRMIKNRESAARSRARKQAYTVELEAELNQLKEENAQLKHALVRNGNVHKYMVVSPHY
ncbi:Protein ABSCISIC ACID-INSENSITIVE like [Actinidia chinensis var. chinensis]|uniref:Protein ABSCISIC ACID-INSENSITIVE like n=1 Tax=Actinidia chinensis var. chinensis TaxID=1590841 RepID=A0A2R6Q3T5_ACTCC|nr:Protein ABSCISIC ACID-INSENSITIVE like [Actinidia chinensis var. chinensis]